MIRKFAKHLFQLVCAMVMVVGAVGCEGLHFGIISGGNDDNNNNNNDKPVQVDVTLTRCWRLFSFCGVPTEVDILIDFAKDGKFTIYQRSEELTYTVFNGTYTTDEENKRLSGVYSDGVKWATDYIYDVNTEVKELTLESVNNPSEVAIYEIADAPVTKAVNLQNATPNDVKPL